MSFFPYEGPARLSWKRFSVFFFGGKKPQPKAPAMRRKPAPEGGGQKRGAYRAAVEFAVYYELVGREGQRRARCNDLSAGGLRFVGDEDFVPGQIIELRFTLPSDFLEHFKIDKEVEEISPFGTRKKKVQTPPPPFVEMRCKAKSLITFFNLNRRSFMHGMQFVDMPVRFSEEIQRFNHYFQLNQLRVRNLE